MKNLLVIMLVLFSFVGNGQQTIKILPPHTPFESSQKTVLMDELTFGAYHFYREKFDSLKILIPEYENRIEKSDSMYSSLDWEYKKLIIEKDRQIKNLYQSQSKSDKLLESSINETRQCLNENVLLQKKNEKLKRQRNVFALTGFVLAVFTAGVIIF